MKNNRSFKRFLTLLLCSAMIVVYMPSPISALADETSDEVVTEEKAQETEGAESVKAEAKAVSEQVAEEKDATNDAAEAEEAEETKTETSADAAQVKAASASDVTAESEVDNSELKVTAAADESEDQEEETKDVPEGTKVVVTFYYKTYSGADKSYKATMTTNNTKTFKQTQLSGLATSYTLDGNTYTLIGWEGPEGEVTLPYKLTYANAAANATMGDDGMGHYDINAVYEIDNPVTVTLNLEDIRHTDGRITTSSASGKVSPGLGWSKAGFESETGLRTGQTVSYMGYEYTYTGKWTDNNENIIDLSTPLSFKYGTEESAGNNYYVSEDITLTFRPVWDEEKIQGLEYKYIDNISTGSGSWSNKDAYDYYNKFGSLKHTFTNPEVAANPNGNTPVEHYRFVYWQTDEYLVNGAHKTSEEGKQYKAGDSFTYSVDSGLAKGSETEVNIYAYWQPSVTVVYHYDGEEKEVEYFDSDIEVYKDAPEGFDIDGESYIGWYDADGKLLSADTTYALPGITKVPVDQAIYHVYAKKAITIEAASNSWEYDGTEHTDNGYTVTKGASLLGDDEITVVNTGAITNAGSVDNEVDEVKITRDGKDVTSYYEITFEKGTLTVTPAPLTITTQGATKVYDGTALTNKTATVTGLVNDETAAANGTGSQTAVGSSQNGYSVTWGTADESNYEITVVDLGTLTVTPAPATKTGGNGGSNNNGGGNGGGGTTVATAGTTVPGATIVDDPTPKTTAPTTIIDDPTPTAEGTWALINLILAIVTLLGGLIALFRRKEEEDEDEEDEQMYDAYQEEEDEEDNRGKKMLAAKIAGALAAIAAPIVFILTEDITLPMVMIDRWTILMIVILAVQIVAAVFNKKASELDDEEEDEEAEGMAY